MIEVMFLSCTFVFVSLSLSTEEPASLTVLSCYSEKLTNLQLQLKQLAIWSMVASNSEGFL